MFRVINNSKNGGILILSSKTFWSCKFLVLQETLYFFKITMCQRKCLLFLVTFSILLTNCYTARFLHNDLKHMKLLARYTRRCKTVSLFAIVMNGHAILSTELMHPSKKRIAFLGLRKRGETILVSRHNLEIGTLWSERLYT